LPPLRTSVAFCLPHVHSPVTKINPPLCSPKWAVSLCFRLTSLHPLRNPDFTAGVEFFFSLVPPFPCPHLKRKSFASSVDLMVKRSPDPPQTFQDSFAQPWIVWLPRTPFTSCPTCFFHSWRIVPPPPIPFVYFPQFRLGWTTPFFFCALAGSVLSVRNPFPPPFPPFSLDCLASHYPLWNVLNRPSVPKMFFFYHNTNSFFLPTATIFCVLFYPLIAGRQKAPRCVSPHHRYLSLDAF